METGNKPPVGGLKGCTSPRLSENIESCLKFHDHGALCRRSYGGRDCQSFSNILTIRLVRRLNSASVKNRLAARLLASPKVG